MKDAAVEELVKLGLTEYQSRVYCALTSLGPSGVTEINRLSGVPRTKVYETLQELITKGMVEFQAGRPALYRSIRPVVLTKALTESYLQTAQRAERLLEGRYESVREVDQDLVWTVRGDTTIRRKLAELLSSAKQSILILEVYPPSFILSLKSVLKAGLNRGLKVRALCVIAKGSPSDFPEPEIIEYRSISPSALSGSKKRTESSSKLEEDPDLKPLILTLSGPYGAALIDEKEAFVIIPNPTESSRSIGFSAKIPGVPSLMRQSFEKLASFGTRINP
ncbi:MAG: TrmB family transcriptional regulator [Nitrososphaerales archaeon]